MPEVSRFYGIVIAIFYRDHEPPHFHAAYGTHRATVHIRDGRVVGYLPRRAARLVEEWRRLHWTELLANWGRARENVPLEPIPPLE